MTNEKFEMIYGKFFFLIRLADPDHDRQECLSY